jgi:hypothetical protein
MVKRGLKTGWRKGEFMDFLIYEILFQKTITQYELPNPNFII